MSSISPSIASQGLHELFEAARKDAHTDAAKAAVGSDPFTRAADLAFKNIQNIRYDAGTTASEGRSGNGINERPQLATPSVPVPTDPKQAMDSFTFLMATLIAMLGDVSTEGLKARLEMLKNMARSSMEGYERLSDAYLAAVQVAEDAQTAAGASGEQLQAAREQLAQALQVLAHAQAALDDLAGLDPESAEYRAAVQAHGQAQANVGAAQQRVTTGQGELDRLMIVAQSSLLAAERLAAEVDQVVVGPLPPHVADGMKRQMGAAATLSLLLLQFAELMGDAAIDQMNQQQTLFKDMQASRQKGLEAEGIEYQKQVDAAAKMSKIAGLVGKILGGIVMLVGAVVAVAGVITGGLASIGGVALFAVGLALTTGDMLTQHFTGVSFMAEAMKPVMDNVIMPAVEWVVEQVTAILQALIDSGMLDFLNLPEGFAQTAGAIIGTVGALVAMVAVVVVVALVGGSIASKLADQLAGVAAKMFEKMVPKLLEHMVTVGVEAFQQATKQIATALLLTKVQAAFNVGKIALTGIEVGGAVTAAGFGAAAGTHQKQASETLADVNMSFFIGEQLQEMLKILIEHYMQSAEAVSKNIDSAFSVMQRQQETAVHIAQKI